MERKIRHRIVGMLVVAAVVIILLPIFQNPKETMSETDIIAPPFPGQGAQVNASADNIAKPPVIIPVNQPQSTTVAAEQVSANSSTEGLPPSAAVGEPVAKLTSEIEPSQANAETTGPTTPEVKIPPVAAKESTTKRLTLVKKMKALQAQAKPLKAGEIKMYIPDKKIITHKPFVAKSKLPVDQNGLLQLKDAAWVIQLGSFKNKANAVQLVNQLRANGYRAFMQQISSFAGENTRVYVGPELKHIKARELATRLEQDLHVHGIVISYKPLAL